MTCIHKYVSHLSHACKGPDHAAQAGISNNKDVQCGVAVLDNSIRFPQKLIIFILEKKRYKYPKNSLYYFENKITGEGLMYTDEPLYN